MVIKIPSDMYIIFYDMIHFSDYYGKLYNLCFADVNFFKTMAAALADFTELPCHAPIQLLLEVRTV